MTRHPVTFFAATCAILTVGLPLFAQSPQPVPTTPPPAANLSTGTRLVVVDVVVQDHDGHPLHGLKMSDFKIVENKTPQSIKTFDEHSAGDQAHAKAPSPLHLPPGVFTNYTPVPEDTTLNVLLLDTLNTPMNSQSFVHAQLRQYLEHAAPGTRIAIFGLTSRLIYLQGFTSDPGILKSIVEHKLLPRTSVLLDDPVGTNTGHTYLADAVTDTLGAVDGEVANLQQFEADSASAQTQLRTRYTLDAFNQLARYLGAFPGRKNLIWFSGSFPLSLFPDPTLNDPFTVQSDASGELRQTSNLLNRARVAVYPIDARGLQNSPVFDASRSGKISARSPGKMASDIGDFSQVNAQEHMSMAQIATDTGGNAFYDTNGLADAVSKSVEAGSNYYTLTYSPSDREWKGNYRHIHVQLQGEPASRNVKLTYRPGYYALDSDARAGSASLLSVNVATPAAGSVAYGMAAMQRGAPTPSEIVFKVQVLPDSTTTEDKLAPNNQLNPNAVMKGPFRLYNIDFAAFATDFAMPLQPDGHRHGSIEFMVYVYSADSKLLNIDGQTVDLNFTPENYDRLLKSSIGYQLKVSAPAHSESFLRIAVHDLTSGRFGIVEIPTAIVSSLPPQPPAAVPSGPSPASK